jgi:hypothetical protein
MVNLPRQLTLLIAVAATLGACEDSTSVTDGVARLRIVNSVFQGDSARVAVPIAVDVLVDSSMSGAGVSGLAALALSPGSASDQGAGAHAGAGALFTAAGYRDLHSGVHSFAAHANAASGPGTSVFRAPDGTSEYLPKQFLMPYPYTLILAGTARADGTAPDSVSRLQWAMIADDPFPPPADPAGGLTARVQVINAAPMAAAPGGGTDITAAFVDAAGDTLTATASYRASSGYINPPAGTYTLTLTTGSGMLYTGSVTLAKGEVRSFIVQSTAYAATPGPGNTKITNLLDNQW